MVTVVNAVREADAASFESFFVAHYRRVVAIAERIVGDRATAEDTAQEAFAQFARRHRGKFGAAAGWLYAAAAHLALNEIRSRRRRSGREQTVVQRDRGLREALEREGDPSSILARKELHATVVATMARLRTRDAALLALRYAGLSHREIAQSLRVPEGHVGSLLARAQRAFRKEFENGLSDR